MKEQAEYASFQALDIRVGRIVKVEEAETRKPTYRMTVDFGEEVGLKVSCGALTNYPKEELEGRQVIGIVNFPALKMGPERSEVLILGAPNEDGATIHLKPESDVPLGALVF
ncbi:MAG: protein secretion chaperonin CsaA [Longimicrobiales bacterium]